jgi:hypothetical protein
VGSSALIVNDVATCPLCSAAFDGGEPYRDHLEQAHGLEDDEGTATVTQLHANRIEDEAAMSLVAEAELETPAPLPEQPSPNSARKVGDSATFRAEVGGDAGAAATG